MFKKTREVYFEPFILTSVTSQQGSRRGPSSILLYLTIASFLLSTAYWALSVALLMSRISGAQSTGKVSLNDIRTTFNAVILVNCTSLHCFSFAILTHPIPSMKVLFADGVVVWRMYILCALDFAKGILSIPILFLGILFG